MNRFVQSALLSVVAMTGAASNVHSAPTSYSFVGTIYDVTINNDAQNLIGLEITGSFSYDPATASQGNFWRSDWRDYLFSSGGAISINVAGRSFTQNLIQATVINDFNPVSGYYLDRFLVQSGVSGTSADFIQLWIDGARRDMPSNFLNSVELPVNEIDLTEADLGASPIVFQSGGLAFSAWVTSITPMAPIPEPSTYALMALGLGAVAYKARRRKATPAA